MPIASEKNRIIVEWEEPEYHLEKVIGRSGLEIMEAYISGELPPPPIARLIQMEIIEVREGYALLSATPERQYLNTLGSIHGGFTATVLDSAMGCAIHTTLPAGVGYSTMQLNLHYTRPIMPDAGTLTAEGEVVYRGRRMMTAEAYLRDDSGKLYAHATTTCMILG